MKIFTILYLLGGLLAFNKAEATDCPLPSNGPILSAYSLQDGRSINCEYVSKVGKTILEIEEFSEDKVAVNLLVRSAYDNASFDNGTNIEVPEQLVFYGSYGAEYPVSLASNLSVVAHEYGHALLQKKIERELSNYPGVMDFIKTSKEISRASILVSQNYDSKELQKELSLKMKEITDNKDHLLIAKVTTAYSELYADIVAVYLANNKDDILNALYYDDMNSIMFKILQCRSFNTEFNRGHENYMSEAHGYFALTRNYIGKNLWPSNSEDKKIMLKTIGDAIIEEIKSLLDKNAELPNYKEANKLLIERLQKSAK